MRSPLCSRITQDSGIHTVSTRRDSAFSGSAIQKSCSLNINGSSCCRSHSNLLWTECYAKSHSHSVENGYAVNTPSNALQNSNVCSFQADEEYCKEQIKFLKEHPPDNQPLVDSRQKPKNFSRLCSSRLFPTRQQTNNAILSILESGEVCVEFINLYGSKRKELVRKVIRISSDGSIIYVYEPEGGKIPPNQTPPPLPSDPSSYVFDFDSLPEVHWKKYVYASHFVDMVKAKTPKVTYYSDRAKCFLMENLTDFETMFYNGGKVVQLTTFGVPSITVTDSSGFSRKVQTVSECNSLTKSLYELWISAEELKNHCLNIESSMKLLPGKNFPLIVGRRPTAVPTSKENQYNVMPSFAVSVQSTMAQPTSTHTSHSKGKTMLVPAVGSTTVLPDGRIYVQCIDGEQMWIDDKHKISYKYSDGRVLHYSDSDSIPNRVLEKFQEIRKVLHSTFPKSSNHKIQSIR